MGLDSGDTLGHADPIWRIPQFILRAGDKVFVSVPPRCCFNGWDGLTEWEEQQCQKCNRLTAELNAMEDHEKALRIARAHKWFDDQTR